VCSIELAGKGAEEERRTVLRDLRDRLGASYTETGNGLLGGVRGETRPGALLAELDRIARALGASDAYPPPRSRARAPSARLWTIAETVVARAMWRLATADMRLPPRRHAHASIIPMAASGHARPVLSSHLFVSHGRTQGAMRELLARAGSHGYAADAERHPDIAVMKLQRLSARAALAEARFLEAEIARLSRG